MHLRKSPLACACLLCTFKISISSTDIERRNASLYLYAQSLLSRVAFSYTPHRRYLTHLDIIWTRMRAAHALGHARIGHSAIVTPLVTQLRWLWARLPCLPLPLLVVPWRNGPLVPAPLRLNVHQHIAQICRRRDCCDLFMRWWRPRRIGRHARRIEVALKVPANSSWHVLERPPKQLEVGGSDEVVDLEDLQPIKELDSPVEISDRQQIDPQVVCPL